jgi:hypothetical protein
MIVKERIRPKQVDEPACPAYRQLQFGFAYALEDTKSSHIFAESL